MAVEGLATVESGFGPTETMDRLEEGVKALGMAIFARIDHGAGAQKAGLELRPTELLIFGAAKGGTPLMQVAQTIGVDLPLKALVWRDEAGATWISWNDPVWLARRHGLGKEAEQIAARMGATLRSAAEKAAGRE
jgi:uncharacterized protein (DUF302 family)